MALKTEQWKLDAMVRLYLDGYSVRGAAAAHGKSKIVCQEELKRRGIKVIDRRKNTPEQKNAMVQSYLNGNTMEQAAAKEGLSLRSCQRALIADGISRRSAYDREFYRYGCDETFFETIDTEKKAYVLGLMATDGSVSSRGFCIEIQLQRRDKNILEAIKKCMKYDGPIQDKICNSRLPNREQITARNMCRLAITSKKLAEDIRKQGICPKKTFTVKPWIAPSDKTDLQAAYWRGAVDGDGGICKIKRGWQIHFAGNQFMVEGFRSFAESVCGTKARQIPHGNIYGICIGGKAVTQRLISVLYGNASICIDRKKELSQLVLAESYR
jgi:hypothetical protein